MKDRIFRSIFYVAIAVLLATFGLVAGVLYVYFNDGIQAELKNSAGYASRGLTIGGLDYLCGLDGGENRITWIASDGSVLYDSTADSATMDNHLGRSEVAAALQTGSGSSARYSSTFNERTYYYALRQPDGTVLRLSTTQRSLVSLTLNMIQPVALIFLVAIVMSAVIGTNLARKITKPINDMDPEHPEQCQVYPELAPLLLKMQMQNRVIAQQLVQMQIKQQELATVTRDMSEGLLIVGKNDEILSMNSSVLRLLQLDDTPENTTAHALSDLPPYREALDRALRGEQNEQKLEMSDRHCRIAASPVLNGGNVAGAVLVILDLTEQENSDNLRREFTANVSHELKTPLTSISGTAEILMNGMVRAEDIPHFAENIYQEAQRLISLVEDVIKLSQLDEGIVSLESWNVDLYALSASVVDRLQDLAARKDVRISVSGEHCQVFGVERILDEMIYNLCDNAIKYNIVHGSVNIRITETDGRTVLTVSDTGIGIPAIYQGRVFERFFRADKSHSKSIGGTGLGLSIVKHGAAYHHAELSLASEPGKGTTITIIF